MNLSEIAAMIRAANPVDEIILCRSPNGGWHLVHTSAIDHCVSTKDNQYEIIGWKRHICCWTHKTPLDRDDRIESVIDRKTLKRCLEMRSSIPGGGLCPVHLGSGFCAYCLDTIQHHLKEFVMPIDTTKLIIVCSDGSTHQAETMASAKQLAKQLVGDKVITATIYVPHTKLERLLPPVKATRINTKF